MAHSVQVNDDARVVPVMSEAQARALAVHIHHQTSFPVEVVQHSEVEWLVELSLGEGGAVNRFTIWAEDDWPWIRELIARAGFSETPPSA